PNFGSALSYIPEAAWNESGARGLGSSGGGVSQIYPRRAWQTGRGVPNDHARHGRNHRSAGSISDREGISKAARTRHINPQIYRLAQSAPSAFHDTMAG